MVNYCMENRTNIIFYNYKIYNMRAMVTVDCVERNLKIVFNTMLV